MNMSTIILLAVVTMTAVTFINPRDCRLVCRLGADGVVVAQQSTIGLEQ